MTSPIDSTSPQMNFPVQSLPQGTVAFYDSKQFAQNEMKVLGATIQSMQKGFEEGQKQIQDAINGLT